MRAKLFEVLHAIAAENPGAIALRTQGSSARYSDILTNSQAWSNRLARFAGLQIGITVAPSELWLAIIAACDNVGISIVLLNPQSDAVARFELARKLGLAAMIGDETEEVEELQDTRETSRQDCSTVTILTSGTTGTPKRVVHTWESLSRPVRTDREFRHSKWLLTYPLHLYAGLQVFSQCFWNAGTLHLLQNYCAPAQISNQIVDEKIEYISATPSFWRRLLIFGSKASLRRASLKNVTLGGEAVGEDILRCLREVFPHARISHIYATSELGRCFAVSDERPGFPTDYLQRSRENGVELRIRDGELQIRSPNRMAGYDNIALVEDDSWFSTEDLVEVVGDRVLFRGRKGDVINIGGNKVHPFEVEALLREVPGVAEAQVHPIMSSLAGFVLGARIAPQPGIDVDELKKSLVEHGSRRLRPHERPRIVEFVSQLQLSEAKKVTRGEASPRVL